MREGSVDDDEWRKKGRVKEVIMVCCENMKVGSDVLRK